MKIRVSRPENQAFPDTPIRLRYVDCPPSRSTKTSKVIQHHVQEAIGDFHALAGSPNRIDCLDQIIDETGYRPNTWEDARGAGGCPASNLAGG